MDEQQIKKNIKLIICFIIFFVVLLLVLVFAKKIINKDKPQEPPEYISDISQELGEIVIDEPVPENNNDTIANNSYWNLHQSSVFMTNGQSGLFAADDSYACLTVPTERTGIFNLVIYDAKGELLEVLEMNSDPHFLTIKNNIIYGIYNENHPSKDISKHHDVLFTYDIINKKLTDYDYEIAQQYSRMVGSLIVTEDNIYLTVNDVYKKQPSRIVRIDSKMEKFVLEYNMNTFNEIVIEDIQNGIMSISTEKGSYQYNLSTKKISQPSDFSSVLFYKGKLLSVGGQDDKVLFIENEPLYKGDISAINVTDEYIYIANPYNIAVYNESGLVREIEINKGIISQLYIFGDRIYALDDLFNLYTTN